MKNRSEKIRPGIYLVVDPSMDEQNLLEKLKLSLDKGISMVQIWDHFKDGEQVESLIDEICSMCKPYHTPVFINNRWEYLKTTSLDGVHFDVIPENIDEIRKDTAPHALFGLTCENALDDVRWAAAHDMDYISFCSMFPSTSVSRCEIVRPGTVVEASKIFDKPIFLAGGINPTNLRELDQLKYDGIAVISGIMNSEEPGLAIDAYHKILNS